MVLDADKEGFLRSERSLIQGIGRAARNERGRALFFADRVTDAMGRCIAETYRRRDRQQAHNERHGLLPRSTKGSATKSLFDIERPSLQVELESIRHEIAPFRNGRVADASDEVLEGLGAEAARMGEADIKKDAADAARGEQVSDGDGAVSSGLDEHARGAMKTSGMVGKEVEKEVAKERVRLRQLVSKFPNAPGVYLWREEEGRGGGGFAGGLGGDEDGVRIGGLAETFLEGWGEDGKGGDVLYVGKAKNLRKRVLSYLYTSGPAGSRSSSTQSPRIRAMLSRAKSVSFIITPAGEHDALLLEARLIKKLQPAYNVLLRDDKFYPYICVSLGTTRCVFVCASVCNHASLTHAGVELCTDAHAHAHANTHAHAHAHARTHLPTNTPAGEALPRVFSVPRKLSTTGAAAKHRYFGPYTDRSLLRRTLALLEQAFRLRRLRFEARYGDDHDKGGAAGGVGEGMSLKKAGDVSVCPDDDEEEKGANDQMRKENDSKQRSVAEASSPAFVEYHRALSRCVRALEGGIGEVIAEMEADGCSQQARALRSIAVSAGMPPISHPGDPDEYRSPSSTTPSSSPSFPFPIRGELDFLGWDHAPDAPSLDVVVFTPILGTSHPEGDDVGEGREERGGQGAVVAFVEAVVLILKIREGCVTGRFTSHVSVPVVDGRQGQGALMEVGEEEVGEATLGVLNAYYLAADPADIPEVRTSQLMRCIPIVDPCSWHCSRLS